MTRYDLIVIGGGPGGEKAAVKAAYFGYRVALIEENERLGGAAINTGTLPSKTLKETALFFSGKNHRGLYGLDTKPSYPTSLEQFMYRTKYVMESEALEVLNNIVRHRVELYRGRGRFMDPHTVEVIGLDGAAQQIEGEFIIIATGSYPFHPPYIPFDNKRVHDSDTILNIKRTPKSVCVTGAGVIGCEYATILAEAGVKVFLSNPTDQILTFLDQEISKSLITQMEKDGITLLFNEKVSSIDVPSNGIDLLKVHFESGYTIQTDVFLFAAGRNGNTKDLECERVGVKVGKREYIDVDETYRTSVPHIYAIGDVVGFPSLASTSMDQGRVAVAHIFKTKDFDTLAKVIPYGIYTIPEVSMVGMTEEDAIRENIPYCVGRARYKDLPRGKIMGAESGYMKIIFRKEDLVIIGVHLIGNIASEIIHYGMSLVDNKKNVSEVISTVFNYPTLHDLYKYACYDGLGNLSGHKIKTWDFNNP